MAIKRVKFMCTAFRDGFQSVFGARVLTEDFMPAVAAAREAGIDWFEAGGGARFQALYFYGNEDAFHMMDRFRETAGPDADLQTLARGVNVVGLKRRGFARQAIAAISKAHRRIYRSDEPLERVLGQIAQDYADVPEVMALVAFAHDAPGGLVR